VPGEGPAEEARAAAAEPPVVGLVANIRPVKRIDDAVRAFAKIAGRHPSATLRIVGGGDASGVQALAGELGVADRVVCTGRVSDPGAEIARFSIGLLTSDSEGFSNAVMEYMQAGKPVVCTDTGGNPELVEEGECGYLCAVGDSDAMAARLDALLADAGLRERMGAAARRRVRTLCDRSSMIEAHIGLYGALSGKGDVSDDGVEAVARKS
jgi:glycosyltransferase involved in cell wall biosynthesis